MSERFLEIEVMHNDPHLVELYVSVSSGAYRGETSVYAGLDEIADFVAKVNGFPRSPSDRRALSWGSRERGEGVGGAAFEFVCVDGLGHAGVWVELVGSDRDRTTPGQRARVFVPFDPAELDRFVGELQRMSSTLRGVACLGSGGPTRR